MVIITKDLIKGTKVTMVAEGVKPDSRKRVVLPKIAVREGTTYHVYHNSFGQIILDPQVTIPASEVWLFEDKNALALVDKGMAEAATKPLIKRGSFAKYVSDAT
jgi:hypothetical protein